MAAVHPVDAAAFSLNRPLFSNRADRLMASLGELSDTELAKATGLAPKLLTSLRGMIRGFPDKRFGIEDKHAFTGIVFKQLATAIYSAAEYERMARNVRIISSVYGWLRPDDIIKPYRLDFKSRPEPGAPNMMRFWRPDTTNALLEELRTGTDREIIDLLPADAAKCIDWKAVEPEAEVWHVDFKIVAGHGGTMRTPDAGKLKKLRGQLLDLALRHGALTARAMARIEGPDFVPADINPVPGTISFVSA